MRTKIVFSLLIYVVAASGLFAQKAYIDNVKFENPVALKDGDRVSVSMDVILDELNIRSNDRIVLTPVLKANNSQTSHTFPAVIVQGGKRQKVYNRTQKLYGKPVFEVEPLAVIHRKNKESQAIGYTASVPFQSWMRDASLYVTEDVTGCAECDLGHNQKPLIARIISEPYVPTYKLTYIVPEAEPVKQRDEASSAYFNFKVGRHELLTDFGNNASELNRVDRVVREVLDNKDLSFTHIEINGFASPEGTFASNMSLSDRRAKSFANYLMGKYNFTASQLQNVNGKGEDWGGLRKAVEASTQADKQEILNIIDTEANPDARDAKLIKLSNGATYRTLLNDFYPPLRRTDYSVRYVARAFDVEEAKQIIRTNPKLLSLNEMYLVAETYPADSKEFKEVFDIAARLYPNDPIAILNSAATDIQGGNNQAGISRLSKIENDARAWNNLGVAYARLGNLQKAAEYFKRAVAQNDADAKNNLAEVEKVLAEQ